MAQRAAACVSLILVASKPRRLLLLHLWSKKGNELGNHSQFLAQFGFRVVVVVLTRSVSMHLGMMSQAASTNTHTQYHVCHACASNLCLLMIRDFVALCFMGDENPMLVTVVTIPPCMAIHMGKALTEGVTKPWQP